MIADDRGSQIVESSAIICDHMETHFCDRLRSCDRDRRRSQKMFYLLRSSHSRPQRLRSIWPAPWIETSDGLQFSVRDSRTSDLSAQSRAFIKMVDQAINFQNFSDITLKEKQFEVLKLLVVEEKDVLAVLPTGYGKSLIYYLLPPV